MTIQDMLSWAKQELKHFESSTLDAELLLANMLKKDRIYLMTHNDELLTQPQVDGFKALVKKRKTGYPLAYMLGVKEFYGLEFKVTPAVLIPRPDTEILVEAVLAYLKSDDLILDVGTGAGCIPISLLKNNPNFRAWAIDISQEALNLARENAKKHGVGDRIEFFQSDLLKNLPLKRLEKKNIVVTANLPYVPVSFPLNLEAQFEPELALFAENEGLALYHELFKELESINVRAIFLECYQFQINLLKTRIKKYSFKKTVKMLGEARLLVLENND